MKTINVFAATAVFAVALPAFSQGPPGPHGPFGPGGPGGFGPRGSHPLVLNAPYSAKMSNEIVRRPIPVQA